MLFTSKFLDGVSAVNENVLTDTDTKKTDYGSDKGSNSGMTTENKDSSAEFQSFSVILVTPLLLFLTQ